MSSDLQILIVEGEALISMEIEVVLEDLGCRVHIATSIHDAVMLASQPWLDGVICDLTLNGAPIHDIVDDLVQRFIPVVLCTGYRRADIAPRYRGLPLIEKPFDLDQLALLV